uniref:Uncharacterized protein n=1 Tax=Aegilops tauschii TaxID=37682 RepID=R7VZ29_AEGTA
MAAGLDYIPPCPPLYTQNRSIQQEQAQQQATRRTETDDTTMAAPQPQKTASTLRLAIARGAHQLDIIGYSTWRMLGAHNTVRSRSFDAGGFAWALVCYFVSNTTTTRGVTLASIALALELLRNETDEAVVATASIRIDEPTGAGRWPAAEWHSAEPHVFPAWSMSAVAWELAVPDAFVQHKKRYVMDDCLTVHCSVEVLKEESADGATRKYMVGMPPPPSLSHDIHRLRQDMWWPDVTFTVDDAKVQAHKLVLAARSRVFDAQFFYGDRVNCKKPSHLKLKHPIATTFLARPKNPPLYL